MNTTCQRSWFQKLFFVSSNGGRQKATYMRRYGEYHLILQVHVNRRSTQNLGWKKCITDNKKRKKGLQVTVDVILIESGNGVMNFSCFFPSMNLSEKS